MKGAFHDFDVALSAARVHGLSFGRPSAADAEAERLRVDPERA